VLPREGREGHPLNQTAVAGNSFLGFRGPDPKWQTPKSTKSDALPPPVGEQCEYANKKDFSP
jgi:hypothetical protein